MIALSDYLIISANLKRSSGYETQKSNRPRQAPLKYLYQIAIIFPKQTIQNTWWASFDDYTTYNKTNALCVDHRFMRWIKAILRLKAGFLLLYFLLLFLKKKPKIRYYSQRNYIIIYLAGISLYK